MIANEELSSQFLRDEEVFCLLVGVFSSFSLLILSPNANNAYRFKPISVLETEGSKKRVPFLE